MIDGHDELSGLTLNGVGPGDDRLSAADDDGVDEELETELGRAGVLTVQA